MQMPGAVAAPKPFSLPAGDYVVADPEGHQAAPRECGRLACAAKRPAALGSHRRGLCTHSEGSLPHHMRLVTLSLDVYCHMLALLLMHS